MPFTNFPNGVTSFGIPSLGGGVQLSVPSGGGLFGANAGTVWFVDATNGRDGNPGTAPDQALKTIGRAVTLAGDGTGDTIFVFPGSYAENVVVTKDYITIIGAQYAGYAKPDIGNTTGVALSASGQGFRAIHCRFFSENNSDAVIQTGNGFFYGDCVFDGNGTQTTKGLMRFLPSSTDDSLTASEGVVTGCLFRGCGGTSGALILDDGAAPVGVGSTDNLVQSNIFRENTGPDIATADSGGAGTTYSVQFSVFDGNIFEDKNKATYVDLTTANGGAAGDQSGTFSRNGFASDTMTTTKIKAVGTAFTFMGNYDTVGIFDGSGLD